MHASDITARKTFLGVDDKKFRAEQKRTRQPKQQLPDIPNGPCCARCKHWQPPGKHDDFGLCRKTVYDPTAPPERRLILTRDEAMRQFVYGEPVRVRGFGAACSLYEDGKAV